eukprot:2260498-Ditylum_brightwellii.AAC.1
MLSSLLNLSSFNQEELGAIISAAQAANVTILDHQTAIMAPLAVVSSVSPQKSTKYPTYRQYYSTPTNDVLYNDENVTQSDFIYFVKYLHSGSSVDHKLLDVCSEPPCACPVFLFCEQQAKKPLHLVVLHGLHHHNTLLRNPTQWDNGYYIFLGNTSLENVPAMVEFDED